MPNSHLCAERTTRIFVAVGAAADNACREGASSAAPQDLQFQPAVYLLGGDVLGQVVEWQSARHRTGRVDGHSHLAHVRSRRLPMLIHPEQEQQQVGVSCIQHIFFLSLPLLLVASSLSVANATASPTGK